MDKKNGFTLVELLVAMLVASIVLAAVGTLAHAACSANDITDHIGRTHAQLRQVSVRLGDAVKQANRVVEHHAWGFLLWQDANADGVLDHGEMTVVYRCYVYDPQAGVNTDALAVRTLKADEAVGACGTGWDDGFRIWQDSDLDWNCDAGETVRMAYSDAAPGSGDASTELYKSCHDPAFDYGNWQDGKPRTVLIGYTMDENGQTQHYSLTTQLRVSDE